MSIFVCVCKGFDGLATQSTLVCFHVYQLEGVLTIGGATQVHADWYIVHAHQYIGTCTMTGTWYTLTGDPLLGHREPKPLAW